LADEDHGEPPQSATLAADGAPVKRRGTSSDCATAGADGTVGRQEGSKGRGEAHMTRAGDERQDAQVVFEYARDPMFRSTHADGFIGGLTPNGQIHIAFFSERPVLPKRHVFKLNPDGSLGAEVPSEKAATESITRDMQVDVLLSMQAAEGLKNWLDQYLTALKSRAGGAETRTLASAAMAPIPIEGGRVAAAQ
jgi:hypothetical protein